MIAVDDCELFDSVIQGPWSGTFPLSSCRVASQRMEVSIRSTTHQPDNGDLRQLGVAVASVEITPVTVRAGTRPPLGPKRGGGVYGRFAGGAIFPRLRAVAVGPLAQDSGPPELPRH